MDDISFYQNKTKPKDSVYSFTNIDNEQINKIANSVKEDYATKKFNIGGFNDN